MLVMKEKCFSFLSSYYKSSLDGGRQTVVKVIFFFSSECLPSSWLHLEMDPHGTVFATAGAVTFSASGFAMSGFQIFFHIKYQRLGDLDKPNSLLIYSFHPGFSFLFF